MTYHPAENGREEIIGGIGEEDIVFDYKLQKGPANSQNAIRLLSFTGFPETIIERAENIRNEYR